MTKSIFKQSLSVLLALTIVLTTCFFAGMTLKLNVDAAAPAGALRTDEDGNFTILQVADVQGTYPIPDQWLNALRLSIATAQPDLIVMTGDNVVSCADINSFHNAVDQIVAEFYRIETTKSGTGAAATYTATQVSIPFAVTFGNHDYESNYSSYPATNLSIDTQWNYYLSKGAINYQKTALSSDGGTALPKGTGYIDIYDNAGNSIVQRVILLNSGDYVDGDAGRYARPGSASYFSGDSYAKVVNCVNNWTSTSSIKCIGFQHIPLQEFYKGDSNTTKILKSSASDGTGYHKGHATYDTSITNNYFAPNTDNSTVSGQYTEPCCCSYNSTYALYKAYSKSNVYGLFYGHDHGNTLTGVTTITDGTVYTLRQGYGGGINTQANGAGTSLFSLYTLNSEYTGPTDNINFYKESHAYADYLEELGGMYGPRTYTPSGINYVTELFAEIAPLSIFQVETFERAKNNVLVKADYVLDKMANVPSDNADLQKGADTGDTTYYVALGYDLTTDRTKAVTGIIGLQVLNGASHPSEITVYLQDNTPVTYYLEDNNCNCAMGIKNVANLIYFTTDPKAGPPITNLYMTEETNPISWGHYGISGGVDNIPKPYKVSYTVSAGSAANTYYMEDWNAFDFNRSCGSTTPYIYLAYASVGTQDVTRAYYDLLTAYEKYGKVFDSSHQVYTEVSYTPYNTLRNQVDNFLNNNTTGVNKTVYSERTYNEIIKITKELVDAYNALEHKPADNGKQVKSNDSLKNDFKINVPDTIYMQPRSDGANPTVAQCYLNNKFNSDGELVPDGTTSPNGVIEIQCDDAIDIDVHAVRMKPQSSGQRFQFNENGSETYYYPNTTSANVPGNLYLLCNVNIGTFKDGSPYDSESNGYSLSYGSTFIPAVMADGTDYIKGTINLLSITHNTLNYGDTGMIEWRITVTRANGTIAYAYAYSTIYSPYIGTTGAMAEAGNDYTQGFSTKNIWVGSFIWWQGITGVSSYATTNRNITAQNPDSSGTYVPDTSKFNPMISGITATNGTSDPQGWFTSTSTNPTFSRIRYMSSGTSWRTCFAYGATALLAADTSRFSNISQIPNLKGGFYMTDAENVNTNKDYRLTVYSDTLLMGCTASDDVNHKQANPTCSDYQYSSDKQYNGANADKKVSGDTYSGAGLQYNGTVSYAISGTTTYNFALHGYIQGHRDGKNYAYAANSIYAPITVKTVDKQAIRDLICEYESLSPQKDWILDSEVGRYQTYMNALVAASYALGNPAYYDAEINVTSNILTPLSTAFLAIANAQKRSCVIDGQTVPYFTTEVNFAVKGVLDGYGRRTSYVVDNPAIEGLFRYQGADTTGDGVGDGIDSLATITVQPYDFYDDYGYNYMGWMDGEGFLSAYAEDPSHWSGITEGYLPQIGDTMTDNMLLNLYTDFDDADTSAHVHPTSTPIEYGHITMDEITRRLNEFYFYYKKTDHRLTIDVGAGQFTIDSTTKTGTQYSTVAAEDDSFTIGFTPTRAGYIFDGWRLTNGHGTYDSSSNTYTFGDGDDTLTAIWVKQSWLYVNSDGGYSKNNLIYFYDGRDTTDYTSASLTVHGSYEDDSDINLTGTITATGSEITPQLNNKLIVHLEKGHTYQLSFDCTNYNMDFYVYKVGTAMGCRSGRMKNYRLNSGNYIQNDDGTYTGITTFTVGGTGTDATDRTWNNSTYNNDSYELTADYNFRISVNKSQASASYTIKNLKIVELDPGAEDKDSAQLTYDNIIEQLSGRTRIIPDPEQRPDGYIFGGWEVYNMSTPTSTGTLLGDTMDNPDPITDIIFSTGQGYTFVYQDFNVGLKAIWIKPIGVALDNMFNFYDFRYNDRSNKLIGSGKTNGDTVTFNNTAQTITVKDDGLPNGTLYDVYTNHDLNSYDMPLFVDANGNKVRTYLFTMDITVVTGTAQYFLFAQKGDANKTNSTNWILTSEYPTSSKHICTLVTAADDTEYLRVRFGFNAQNSKVTYSNIRIVPVETDEVSVPAAGSSIKFSSNAAGIRAILEDDILGYAYDETVNPAISKKITPATSTYNLLEGDMLYTKLYTPTRYGYAFTGWIEDGIVAPANEDGYFNYSTVVEENKTVWSSWSADEFILQYNKNTTDTIASMPNNATNTPSATSWTLIFDKKTVATTDDVISKTVPTDSTSSDKVFVGWCTVADPTSENPGEMFYPGGNLTRATVNRIYGEKNGDNNVLTLYAQWYNTKPAKDDAARKNTDLAQQNTNVIRGIELNADGTYKSTLYEMSGSDRVTIYKFKTDLYSNYTSAISSYTSALSAYNASSGGITKTINATTVANLTAACAGVTSTASALGEASAQNDVNYEYVADKAARGFFIKDSSGNETRHTLAEMNLNHYLTATLNEASTAKTTANNSAFSSYTSSEVFTWRKAFDSVSGGTAQAKLNSAVETMAKDFVKKQDIGVDPMYKIYETPDKVAQALGSSSDIDAVNYVYTGLGNYTYYCYTNKLNPKMIISVDEIASNGRVCYPTTAEKVSGGNDASITTETITNSTYDTYLQNGLGTSKNANYYKQKQLITINPSFVGSAARTTVSYKFKAYDDSYVANNGKNYASKSSLSGDVFNSNQIIDIPQTSVTGVNEISIIINYKSDNGLNVTGSQWNVDQYLNQYHLYRTSGGANNWEIHGKNDAPSQLYAIYDEDYKQLNYCSFFYVFRVGSADDNAKCQIKSTNLSDVHNFIKNNFNNLVAFTNKKASGGTGLGYKSWSGADGWSPNLYPLSNSYVYVHVLDRWGNVFDDVLPVQLIDPNGVAITNSSVGSVKLVETGGSGIATASLNAGSIQIITDEDSTLVDNVYRTTGNSVKLYTGEANKSYTLNITDNATNASKATVKTDSQGYLTLTVEDNEHNYDGTAYTFTLGDFEINLFDGVVKYIRSVENGEAYVGEKATATIVTSDTVSQAQLRNPTSGSTTTSTTYVDNGNGTRTFEIALKKSEGTYTYDVRVKVNGKWVEEGKTATLTFTKKPVPTVGEVVKVEYTPSLNTRNIFNVTVTGEPDRVQLTYPNGGTSTYLRDNASVKSIEKTEDGEIWAIQANLAEGDYSVRAKFNGTWSGKTAFTVTLLKENVPDTNVYSIDIDGLEYGSITRGKHEVTVVTGKDVTAVMLKNTSTGSTDTFTESNATVEEIDEKLVWKFKVNFSLGNDKTYLVKVRTEKTRFQESDKSISFDVIF